MAFTEKALDGLHDHLFDSLPFLPAGPILDIACGTGAWLSRFTGRALVGIDLASKTEAPGIEFVSADIDSAHVDLERRFALVSAIEIVEHLENPGRLIELAARHVAPDGWFLLSTPNVHSALARLRWLVTGKLRFFDASGESTHLNPITLAWARAVLPRHGFEVVRIWGFPERGSRACRRLTAAVAPLLGWMFPLLLEGDILCVLARPRGAR